MKSVLAAAISLLSFLQLSTFAQENYLPGYIIRDNSDSVAGTIRYGQWNKNPTSISFRHLNGTVEQLNPLDIRKFGVADRVFVGTIASVDVRSDNLTDLTEEAEFIFKKDTIFLESVIGGSKSLYYLNDGKGLSHFYINKDGIYELLRYKMHLVQTGNNQAISERKEFHAQLAAYLYECPNAIDLIRKSSYNLNSLLDLFTNYYSCTNATPMVKKKRQKTIVDIAVMAGASKTDLKFSGETLLPSLGNISFPSSANFAAGVSANVKFPGALSLNNELFFTSYSTEGTYEERKSENEYSTTESRIGVSYIKMFNQLRLNIPVGRPVAFIEAGISNGIAVRMKNEKTYKFKYYNNEQSLEGAAVENPRKLETGFICGIGASFKKYSAQVKYEKANGFSDIVSVGSRTTRLYLLFGYRLF